MLPLLLVEDKRTRELREGLRRAFCDMEHEREKKKKKKFRTDIPELSEKARVELAEFIIKPYYSLHERELTGQDNGEIVVNKKIVSTLK